MSSSVPPMTPELKPIAPYLQRAEELRYKDPIMAYWCAYYAAQIGISIKAKDTPSRNLLFELLGTLEMMKREIGPNEAINIEAVSSAYVENFALKVFGMADNEDRKGDANRSTAKKFLAAANFLEVLKVFTKNEISESNEEKIRYARWKAADIAKAFREGRNPTPGSSVSVIDPLQPNNVLSTQSPPVQFPASSPPKHHTSPPPQIKRSSPPQNFTASDVIDSNDPHTPPRRPQTLDIPSYGSLMGMGLGLGLGESTPGSWSTAATPGTAIGAPVVPNVRSDVEGIEATVGAAFGWEEPDSPTDIAKGKRRDRGRSGSDSDNEGAPVGRGGDGGSLGSGPRSKKAWVSGELEGTPQQLYPQDPTIPNPTVDLKAYSTHNHGSPNAGVDGNERKAVHLTPSIVGGPSDKGAPVNPLGSDAGPVVGMDTSNASKSIRTPSVLTGAANGGHQRKGSVDTVGSTRAAVPERKRTTSLVTPQPDVYLDVSESSSHLFNAPKLPSVRVGNAMSRPATPPHQPLPLSVPRSSPLPPPPPPIISSVPPINYASNIPRVTPAHIPAPYQEIELTPSLIAKVQKHCRFAISALDYEDAEQARRELMAALVVLGR